MNFKNENGILKVVIAIVAIVIVLIVGILIVKLNKKETFEPVEADKYEYFAVYTVDEKVGVIDKTGKEIIKTDYTNIYIPNQSKDVFVCFKNDNDYSVLDSEGKDIFKEYNSIYPLTISDATMEMEKNVLSYEDNGKYGLVSIDGKKLTNAIYEEVSSLKNKPGCIQVKKDGLYGVLDSEGNTIIEPKYNSVKGDEYSSEKDGYLKTGYIISEKTNSGIIYGYVDYKGKMLIEPKYESITRCLEYEDDDIYLVVMEHGKKGVVKGKKVLIKPKYHSINYYNMSNIFIVKRNEKYGFFDKNGEEILPVDYTDYSIAGDYIAVRKDDSMLLYDVHGNLVNTNNYKSIIETSNPSYFIAEDEHGYYSIISKEFQIENNYTQVSYAFDNFFVYTTEEGKSGVLNVYSGDEIKPEYDVIIVLEGAKALEARKGNELDIYSEKFEKVFTMSDAIVEKVSEDYFSIYSDTEMKYIDKTGKIVSNTDVFKDLKLYSHQTDDGKWGFVDSTGKIVVDCKYDRVTELNQYGFAGICQEGKWGVIDENGKIIIVPSYEIETYYQPSFIGKYLLEEVETTYCTEVSENKSNIKDKKTNKVTKDSKNNNSNTNSVNNDNKIS